MSSVTSTGQKRITREYIGNSTVQNFTSVAWPVSLTRILGVYVTLIRPGGGGGSGRRGAAGTVRGGGGGGGGGGYLSDFWVPASLLGSTYSTVVGNWGLGGSAVPTDDTNGNPGATTGTINFTTGSLLLTISGGSAAGGGTTSGGAAGGTAGNGNAGGGGGGGAGGASGVGTNGQGTTSLGGSGAGGGGGISAGDVAFNGGTGGFFYVFTGNTATVAAAGVVDSTPPGVGTSFGPGYMGLAPGGGAASITQAAQAGADAVAYGVGGGGGGASLNGFSSGAGGHGGPGYARVIFIYQ